MSWIDGCCSRVSISGPAEEHLRMKDRYYSQVRISEPSEYHLSWIDGCCSRVSISGPAEKHLWMKDRYYSQVRISEPSELHLSWIDRRYSRVSVWGPAEKHLWWYGSIVFTGYNFRISIIGICDGQIRNIRTFLGSSWFPNPNLSTLRFYTDVLIHCISKFLGHSTVRKTNACFMNSIRTRGEELRSVYRILNLRANIVLPWWLRSQCSNNLYETDKCLQGTHKTIKIPKNIEIASYVWICEIIFDINA